MHQYFCMYGHNSISGPYNPMDYTTRQRVFPMVLHLKMQAFWDVTPWRLLNDDRQFGGEYCLLVQGQVVHERTWDCSILKKEALERSNIQQYRWEKLITHDFAFICSRVRQPRPRAPWYQRKFWYPLRIQIFTLQFCAHILRPYGNFSSMNRILIQYQGDVHL
jgi:hypothetical protein